MAKGRGFTAGSGRQKGIPNRITRDLREMIIGALHAKGGQAYLEKQAMKNPKAFMALLGKCLPKDLNIQTDQHAPKVIDSSRLTPEQREQLRQICLSQLVLEAQQPNVLEPVGLGDAQVFDKTDE